jgi:tetratricopeptide (TPR) repeat protein
MLFALVAWQFFAADVALASDTDQPGPAANTVSQSLLKTNAVPPSLLKTSDSEPKIIFKPGQPVAVGMQAEDICVTDDVQVAKEQVAAFPDSPDASFILAVALTRTSMVEQALSEVRRARRLAEQQGGPAYFDKTIGAYEEMLKDYPNDNRLRYGLAWAYYMKAYVLAKYSKGAARQSTANQTQQTQLPKSNEGNGDVTHQSVSATVLPGSTSKSEAQSPQVQQAQQAPGQQTPEQQAQIQKDWRPLWVSALATSMPGLGLWGNETPTGSQPTLPYLKGALDQAPPAVVPQVRAYYQSALRNLDELLQRNPNDVWALVYRAFVNAEYTGDLKAAMEVWRACQIRYPDNPAPYFFLGEGYLKEGNLKECLQNISRAVALRAMGKNVDNNE